MTADEKKTALMTGADDEYGTWIRVELADGRTVFIWGCGCCSSPCAQLEDPDLEEGAKPVVWEPLVLEETDE